MQIIWHIFFHKVPQAFTTLYFRSIGRVSFFPWNILIRHAALASFLTITLAQWTVAENLWAAGHTIVDQAGRHITVNEPFSRIISLYGAHTENLFSLGLNQEIIGVCRNEIYPKKAGGKPAFSYHEDPEKFLAAQPDLLLIRPMIDRGYPKLIQRLEASGITVLSFQPSTVEEMYDYWTALGLLTGRVERAKEMIEYFKKSIQRYNRLTAGISKKKRVYFEAIHSKMKTFSPNAMPIFALKTAGGLNVAADAVPVRGTNIAAYGKERILARSLEIDVYLAQNGVMNNPTVSLIKSEPGFHIIKAVKQNRIYLIDEMRVSRPTLRLIEGIGDIGAVLYPDLFTQNFRNQFNVWRK